jgi:hypothetical protein
MKKFLFLKHWQLFLLLVIAPIILQILLMGNLLTGTPQRIILVCSAIMTLFTGTYFGWLYTLGQNLHRKLPPDVFMNLARFRTFLIIPIVYIMVILVYLLQLPYDNPTNIPVPPSILPLILPVHLFSMFCIIYSLYFVAKALKAVEKQAAVTSGDYIGEFILLWFFPLGIWLIQPRINKLFSASADDNDSYIFDHTL